MQEIRITYGEKEGLKASEYLRDIDKAPKLIEQITGEEVIDFLNIIQNDKIKGTKIINETTKIIIYDKYYITLKEYQKLKKTGYLDEYFNIIKQFETEKIESIAPVVKRENKHRNGRIVSGIMASILVLTMAYVIIRESKKPEIEITDAGRQDTTEEVITEEDI